VLADSPPIVPGNEWIHIPNTRWYVLNLAKEGDHGSTYH
jgi:hypothetical protein